MRFGQLLLGLCAPLALVGAAAAQTPTTVPGVTVTAPSNLTPAQQVKRFGQVDSKGRLARWGTPVCPVTAGLPDAFDAFIDHRIRDVAEQVGAVAAPEKCSVNVLILITPQAAAFTRKVVELKSHALASGRWPVDKAKLRAFANDPNPVRWFYVSDTVATLGGSANALNINTLSAAGAGSGLDQFFKSALPGPPQDSWVTPSRLKPAGEEAFTQVVIVVDANRIAGLSAGQISDYLAMLALAQVKAESSFAGTDTVLNLFAPGLDEAHRPTALTLWDKAYLSALYKSDAQSSYTAQVSHITTRIKDEAAQQGGQAAPK